MTLPTLSDDALDERRRKLSQKASDLARDLNAVTHELDKLKYEEHRRFLERIRPIAEGKR